MIKSMTGFAAVTKEHEAASISVTIRSVNHRHLDAQFRLPTALAGLEPALRGRVQRKVARGRVDVAVGVQPRQAPLPSVEVNEALVALISSAMARVREQGLVEGALSPGDLLRVPQVVIFRETLDAEQDAALSAGVEDAVEVALVELDAMRAEEGRLLRRELDARCEGVRALVDTIEHAAQDAAGALETRLTTRLRELALESQIEPALLAQEAVRFVARSDISEELVRFRAHLAHWVRCVEGAEPCGRKLDFLLQEMFREVNTIGSKAEGTRVPELVVTAKAELEKMREQVQNVE